MIWVQAESAKFALASSTLAGALLAVTGASPVHALDVATAVDVANDAMSIAGSTVAFGYDAAPALMLGLALAFGFPLVAFFWRLTRYIPRPGDRDVTWRYRPSREGDVSDEIVGDGQAMSALAFVEVEGAGGQRFAIPRDMIRIGREDDNDIRIPSGAVHRYHAAIHRSDFDDWHITDLSGVEGNGIVVNGQRCSDARLQDGDVIELGPGKLRFRAGLAH